MRGGALDVCGLANDEKPSLAKSAERLQEAVDRKVKVVGKIRYIFFLCEPAFARLIGNIERDPPVVAKF